MRIRLEAADGPAVTTVGDRLAGPDASVDVTVALGPGELRPGLINAHDHLHRNHYPRLGAPPYPDAYAWGNDIHERDAEAIARGQAYDRDRALLYGALKNLLAGATTVVHHDRWEPSFERDFPVRVARTRTVHALGTEPSLEGTRRGDPSLPLCVHLAEGVTDAMADEVRALAAVGLLDGRLIAVHAVGVDGDGVRRLVRAGAAVVWCPTSNAFLFGRTAAQGLIASGVDVLVGSDALLTGAGTLLDELRAAAAYGWLSDEALLEGVGPTAARRLGIPEPTLAPGAPADLVHLARPVLAASARDVELVLVGGVPRLGDERFAELFERARVPVERLRVGGRVKLVAAPLGSVAREVVDACPEAGRILERSGAPPG